MLQARLELAPRVNPDWILSPTRLPIPPLERGVNIFNFQFATSDGIGSLPSIFKILNFKNGVLATGAHFVFNTLIILQT